MLELMDKLPPISIKTIHHMIRNHKKKLQELAVYKVISFQTG